MSVTLTLTLVNYSKDMPDLVRFTTFHCSVKTNGVTGRNKLINLSELLRLHLSGLRIKVLCPLNGDVTTQAINFALRRFKRRKILDFKSVVPLVKDPSHE